jgi:CBS domain-containing protein
MVTTLKRPVSPKLALQAATAEVLMTQNPISVRQDADVSEAVNLMTERGFTIAPVIDASGRAVGVISVSDILIHNRENCGHASAGFATTVTEIMTPTVFAVRPETPANEVVRTLLAHRVHHLFVSDDDGVLVGVISAGDILRHLA